MSHKIALTGVGVKNGSFEGTDRLNLGIYNGTFDGSFPGGNNLDLIESVIKDVRSDLFKDGFEETVLIQITDKISLENLGDGFKKYHSAPDLLTALAKAGFLLDPEKDPEKDPENRTANDSTSCVILISSSGGVVLRNFDRAVSENDRIYAVIEKTISLDGDGDKDKDKGKGDKGDQTTIPEDVNLFTICCDSLRDLTATKLEKIAALIPAREKKSIAANFAPDPMAGLIATSLCVYNRYYPGQASLGISCDITENIPEYISDKTPFYFPLSSRTWFKGGKKKLRKAVLSWTKESQEVFISSFISLAESGLKAPVSSKYLSLASPRLFPVAAASKESLRLKLEKLSERVSNSGDLSKLAKENFLEYKSATAKEFIAVVMGESNAVIKREIGFLASSLDSSFANGTSLKTPKGSYFTPDPLGKKGKVVFVYPGVGSAYTGLGQDLFQMFPQVYDFFSKLAPDVGGFVKEKALYPRINHELSKDELKGYDQNLRKNIMDISQCGMSFSVIYSMIMAGVFNLFPEYALGYSMGEASMMASLMVWKNPGELSERLKKNDAFSSALSGDLTVVREAWNLPHDNKSDIKGDNKSDIKSDNKAKIWESYTLLEDKKKVEELVSKEERVYITLVNTDNELVIAGDPEKCLQVIKKLGCKYFPLKLALAIHSTPAYLAYDKLVDLYSLELNKPSGLKLYSSSCYLPVPLREKAVANSIAKAFCDRVDFPRLVRKVYDDGGRIFIETGPRQTCSLWIDEILAGENVLTVPLNNKGVKDSVSMARAIAMLMSHGVNVNADCLFEF